MRPVLDTAAVARSFAGARTHYDLHASFHARLAGRLAEATRAAGTEFGHVLEIGSHTGLQTRAMSPWLRPQGLWVLSDIHALGFGTADRRATTEDPCRLVMDGQRPALRERTFDLIYSGACFQWFSEPMAGVRQLLGLLRPGGLLAFSIFTAPSLEPLRQAFEDSGEGDRFLPLLSTDRLRHDLEAMTFGQLCHFEEVHDRQVYDHWSGAFDVLRHIGAALSAFRSRPLPSRVWREIRLRLENERSEEGCPLKMSAAIALLRR